MSKQMTEIASILDDNETRETIAYANGKLYLADTEILGTPELPTLEDAAKYVHYSYANQPAWGLEWIDDTSVLL